MASLIEPSSFDLIVLGTGLPQCIIAAAAARSGHSVLHLDSCDFYGSHWASLPLQDFCDWCQSAGQLPFPSSLEGPPRSGGHGNTVSPLDPAQGSLQNGTESLNLEPQDAVVRESAQNGVQNPAAGLEEDEANTVEQDLWNGLDANGAPSSSCTDSTDTQIFSSMEEMAVEPVFLERGTSMYSGFNFMQRSRESLGQSRSYCIDLAGPKLAFCGGQLVDLLLRSGASNYLEFKDLESTFMWNMQGLSPVPSSRADVFRDRSLSNAEKRHLMRFFKLVVDHSSSNEGAPEISQVDLESPFVEFLQGRQVPPSVQAMILYAIALSNHKQDTAGNGQCSIMSTKEGMESLALYLTSVGRFVNATGAFLYPLYGEGELPQAFSRCAAVKGALYALKMPIQALLRDKESGKFKGVQMASNQLIFSEKLVAGPSMYSTLCNRVSCETNLENGDHKEESLKVVRSICITDKSLKPDLSTLLVVFPPHSITFEEGGVIRALQLGSSVSVCPEGKYLVHLSMACSNESVGIEALQGAVQSLFNAQDSQTVAVEDKPTLLWSVSYVHRGIFPQGAKWISAGQVAVCGMPDETLDHRNVVASAEMVFKGLYPDDEFFVGTPSSSPPLVDDANVEEEGIDAESTVADTTET